jgi:hypothetical protein
MASKSGPFGVAQGGWAARRLDTTVPSGVFRPNLRARSVKTESGVAPNFALNY